MERAAKYFFEAAEMTGAGPATWNEVGYADLVANRIVELEPASLGALARGELNTGPGAVSLTCSAKLETGKAKRDRPWWWDQRSAWSRGARSVHPLLCCSTAWRWGRAFVSTS